MEKQKQIKFSEDYQKLPLNWEGTQAVLIGVYPTKTSIIIYNQIKELNRRGC